MNQDEAVIDKQKRLLAGEEGKSNLSGQFALGEKLGRGTFGVVRLGTHILTGEKVAIKQLEKAKITQRMEKTRIEREIKILKIMHHSNIIQLFSVIQSRDTIDLIMEYASGRELFDYIISKQHLSEIESCRFFQQIISGIEYLHKLRIVHRDIKPENLLLDEKNNIKIVDFGLSNLYSKGSFLLTACGSPCYAPPEMLLGKKYKPGPIDIWASGIVLYAMLCGYLPFEEDDNRVLYNKITEGRYTIPDYVSKEGKSMIKRLLTVNPQLRITIDQIKRHPWFNLIRQDTNINEGLLVNLNVIPIDEDIVVQMENYDYTKEQIREAVLLNKHNDITMTYYLLLKANIRDGISSIADFQSRLFNEYINDENNLLSKYNNDIELVLKERMHSKRKMMMLIDKEDLKTSEMTKANSQIQVQALPLPHEPTPSPRKEKKKTIRPNTIKSKVQYSLNPYLNKRSPVKEYKASESKKHHSMCLSERGIKKEDSLINYKDTQKRMSTIGNSPHKENDKHSKRHQRLTTEAIDHIHNVILTKEKKTNDNENKLDFQTSSLLKRHNPIQKDIHFKKNKVFNTIILISAYNRTIKADTSLNHSKRIPMPSCTKGGVYHTAFHSLEKKLKPNKIIQNFETNHCSVKKETIKSISPVKKRELLLSLKKQHKSILEAGKEARAKEKRESNPVRKLNFNMMSSRQKSPIEARREKTPKAIDQVNVSPCLNKVINSSSLSSTVNTCLTPFDLSCMIFNHIREIKDEIGKTLSYHKVHYTISKANELKFICAKAKIYFEMEVLKAQSINNAYTIKVKSIKAKGFEYKELITSIISNIC